MTIGTLPEHEQKTWLQLGQVSLSVVCILHHCYTCPGTGPGALMDSKQTRLLGANVDTQVTSKVLLLSVGESH